MEAIEDNFFPTTITHTDTNDLLDGISFDLEEILDYKPFGNGELFPDINVNFPSSSTAIKSSLTQPPSSSSSISLCNVNQGHSSLSSTLPYANFESSTNAVFQQDDSSILFSGLENFEDSPLEPLIETYWFECFIWLWKSIGKILRDSKDENIHLKHFFYISYSLWFIFSFIYT